MKSNLSNKFLPISEHDICIITPTFNRLKQLNMLLKTLSSQTIKVNRVIVADGKGNAKELVNKHKKNLAVSWVHCPVPGQIPQRKYVLNTLPKEFKLVIYFDDDIQLEANAIEEMIIFWNNQITIPAGVSFNITNIKKQKDNIIRHLFFIATKPYGKVWKSGYNSPCFNQNQNILSDWLPGGATIWRREILLKYSIPDISSKWAICEDLIFSYPVGKKEPLYVCSEAKVKTIDDIKNLGFYKSIERGKNAVFWRLYFVKNNSDLSVFLFYWMNIGLIIGYLIRSISGDRDQFGFSLGTLYGVFSSLISILMARNIRDYLK